MLVRYLAHGSSLGLRLAELATAPNAASGDVCAMVGVASAIWVMWLSVSLAQRAQLALMVPTDCGTGRHEAEGLLMFSMPVALLLPTGAWVVSRIAGYAQLLSRCALWSAMLGWILSMVFVVFRDSL